MHADTTVSLLTPPRYMHIPFHASANTTTLGLGARGSFGIALPDPRTDTSQRYVVAAFRPSQQEITGPRPTPLVPPEQRLPLGPNASQYDQLRQQYPWLNNALKTVMAFEGYSSRNYDDYGSQSTGYGTNHALATRYGLNANNLTEPQARELAARVLATEKLNQVYNALGTGDAQQGQRVFERLTQNQRAAVMDLAYNLRDSSFNNSSFVRHIRDGNLAAARACITQYSRAGGNVLPGLLARREANLRLWDTPDSSTFHPGRDPIDIRTRQVTVRLSGHPLLVAATEQGPAHGRIVTGAARQDEIAGLHPSSRQPFRGPAPDASVEPT